MLSRESRRTATMFGDIENLGKLPVQELGFRGNSIIRSLTIKNTLNIYCRAKVAGRSHDFQIK